MATGLQSAGASAVPQFRSARRRSSSKLGRLPAKSHIPELMVRLADKPRTRAHSLMSHLPRKDPATGLLVPAPDSQVAAKSHSRCALPVRRTLVYFPEMTLCQVDEAGALFISPAILEWGPIQALGIDTVIDLEGGLDHCIPSVPNQVLYVYFPIYDEDLPDLEKLNAVADLAARLIRTGHKVLSHCGMGFNRSALVAGLTLCRLGMSGPEAVLRLRACRRGALFNERFATHLESLAAAASESG